MEHTEHHYHLLLAEQREHLNLHVNPSIGLPISKYLEEGWEMYDLISVNSWQARKNLTKDELEDDHWLYYEEQ